jgi:hypothetical protein
MTAKPFRFGPIALTTTTTTNLLNPGTTTGGVNSTSAPYNNLVIRLTHLRVVNKTATPATVSLWLGATGGNAAGTEFVWSATTVPANSAIEWFGSVIMTPSDFLVGGASAATTLTLQGEGEISVL